jgi:F-type H+-transporting ATPase subunit delta
MTSPADTRLGAIDHLLDEQSYLADELPSDLFAVVDALESSPTLRRAVTDPGTPEGARKGLVHGLFDSLVSEQAATLVAEAAALRWSGGRTFAAAIERQAVRAQLIISDRAGDLDETEDELFRFARLVESNNGLRNALADRKVPVRDRQELVGSLLEGRTTQSTDVLAKRAVAARERTFGHTLEGYVTQAALQKNRVIATVRVARPLDDEQRNRFREALSRQVGRDVVVQVIVEEDLVGGARVELGNEVIEGTVAGRLEEVRRLFS